MADVTEPTETDEEGEARRFDVELFIKHPTMMPDEITTALGIEPQNCCAVGAQRVTPRGKVLPGTYHDTRWRHSVRYDVKDQWFAVQVEAFVDELTPHKAFLTKVTSTGGTASVIIQFLGDGYFGDSIPRDTLAKLVDLGLDFDIECFIFPQRP